jgi:hypothetical protein
MHDANGARSAAFFAWLQRKLQVVEIQVAIGNPGCDGCG